MTAITANARNHAIESPAGRAAAPIISLIVCTRNRADKLVDCLACIGYMHPPFDWELLVVDNGSTDDTADVIKHFMSTFSHPGRYLYVAEPGNGAGRNAAIRLSRGEILAFTDDDCYVANDFLDNVETIFRTPGVGYMSGRINLFDLTDYPLTINESSLAVPIGAGRIPGCGLIQGANFAVRRTALDSAGCFDPDFGAGARFTGEDWELAMRISVAGWSGGYFPAPVVWHHHGRKAGDFRRHFRFYGLGEGAVYAKGLLDAGLRWRVLYQWFKSAAGDVLKRRSYRHLLYVVWGVIQYWRLRIGRRMISLGKSQ